MKVALLCGGPSPERGISLNSARTVLDHLDGDGTEIVPVYFNSKKEAYLISKAWIYSNTPMDFDFKLKKSSLLLTKKRLIKELKKVNIVFPVMHGRFGEDGEIQSFLETNKIPFVGASSTTCRLAFDKFYANEYIRQNGFFAPTSIDVSKSLSSQKRFKKISDFFKESNIKRAIVKPAKGGSSIGVFSVETPEEADEKVKYLFLEDLDERVVVESFAEGKEFTAILVENRFATPVCILPTEIETDYENNGFFDFRKKYLPTRQVTHHCPPRFSDEVMEDIQIQAEQLFSLFGFNDIARFDGWVFPNGRIWFSDFNPVSGMEQNSFLFQQSSRVGFSHRDFLRFVLRNSCRRQGVGFSDIENRIDKKLKKKNKRKRVNVMFGGKTSERQVSLMSGTNAWLKLRNSKIYDPFPYLLDTEGNIWRLSYAYTLNHTVEEIALNCKNAKKDQKRLLCFQEKVSKRLALREGETSEEMFVPEKMSKKQFLERSPYVFLGLHGGDGEDGTLQKEMEKIGLKFNGSGSKVSKICMDKWKTGEIANSMGVDGLDSTIGSLLSLKEAYRALDKRETAKIWRDICKKTKAETIIVKPRSDGCSSGIVKLISHTELKKYLEYLRTGVEFMPAGEFSEQNDIVHMPRGKVTDLVFEKFIETDLISMEEDRVNVVEKGGWLETTVGVLGERGRLRVFNPSITVAEGAILTVEEKFQGGTGINLTPLPESLVNVVCVKKIKKIIKCFIEKVGLEDYGRIDAFISSKTGDVKIIEINSLPALTPSTVLYHQALAEDPPIYPTELLERIIKYGGY